MSQQKIEQIAAQLSNWRPQLELKTPGEILLWASAVYKSRLVFASSLGVEDQVLIHFLGKMELPIRVFTLDTGRLFPQTYDLLSKTTERYGVKIEIYLPNAAAVEKMIRARGINLFYNSIEDRKLCCEVRKIQPLQRALRNTEAWISGLRRGQSGSRQTTQVIEWDETHQLVKINPLWNWSEEDVWSFIHKHQVPYNPLHDQGFASIGCASCTRAVAPGEDVRAGRWWWEQDSHRESGLHSARSKQTSEAHS